MVIVLRTLYGGSKSGKPSFAGGPDGWPVVQLRGVLDVLPAVWKVGDFVDGHSGESAASEYELFLLRLQVPRNDRHPLGRVAETALN